MRLFRAPLRADRSVRTILHFHWTMRPSRACTVPCWRRLSQRAARCSHPCVMCLPWSIKGTRRAEPHDLNPSGNLHRWTVIHFGKLPTWPVVCSPEVCQHTSLDLPWLLVIHLLRVHSEQHNPEMRCVAWCVCYQGLYRVKRCAQ